MLEERLEFILIVTKFDKRFPFPLCLVALITSTATSRLFLPRSIQEDLHLYDYFSAPISVLSPLLLLFLLFLLPLRILVVVLLPFHLLVGLLTIFF